MTTLPAITTKQKEILKLLYTYRFLNRTHIQTLLNHKDKRRVISWLKDLREKEYVDWHYDATDFIAKSRPTVYYLSLNGIRYLREGEHPTEELRKRYKEPGRTQTFIDRCLLIADCCLVLKTKSGGTLQYVWTLLSDYARPDNAHHFLNELRPHLFFTKQDGNDVTNYLLESFELTLPRYQLRKRIKDYAERLDAWDDDNGSVPIVLFVCATTDDLLYIKRRVKTLLEDSSEALSIRVTTVDKVRAHGITGMIWEDIV